jgi:hypothetical protein
VNNRLIIGIGVLRDPIEDIRQGLALPDDSLILTATLPQALTSGGETQASIQMIKAAVALAVTRFRPSSIDLYYVGPAAFAVALGHRWNALPSTQFHEFMASKGSYVPTALIG